VQHIQRGWSFFSEEMNEFVDLLPAQQRCMAKTGIAARRMR
jgi:glucose-1-phosphate adenylyltransferase